MAELINKIEPTIITKNDMIASKDTVRIRTCVKCHREIPTNILDEPYVCCDCRKKSPVKNSFTSVQMEMTKEKFGQLVQQKMTEKNISLMQAIYQVYTTFCSMEQEKSGVQFACNKGCSRCCHQLITCTEIGMDEIKRFIDLLPKKVRRPIIVKLKKFAKKWLIYYQKNQYLIEADMLKQIKDWLGQPCPFLEEKKGICSIYPVRPIDCRTFYSHTLCKNKNDLGSGVVRWYFTIDKIANDFIMEKQKEEGGVMAVTPVHHWLNIKWNFKRT